MSSKKRKSDSLEDLKVSSTSGATSTKKQSKTFVVKKSKVALKNLAAETTDAEFENLVGKVGPVKRCFLIRDKATHKCTGLGFVHYALEDDAKKAIQTLNGKPWNGKVISAKIARPRGSGPGESDDEAEPMDVEVHQVAPVSQPQHNPDSTEINLSKPHIGSRTVVLNGVPMEATIEQIKAFASACGEVDAVEFPVIEAPSKAYVLFKRADSAMDAESKLSSRQLLDKTIIAALFSTAALKQFRLIVRNLAWETTVEDLQTLFGKCGKLYEVHIPAGKTPGTSRGFAFVNYTNATDAQKAVQLCNKQNIRGRAIAVDITIPKEQYDAAVASEKVAQAEIDALNAPAKKDQKAKKLYGSDESDSESGNDDHEDNEEEAKQGSGSGLSQSEDEDEDEDEEGEDEEDEEDEEEDDDDDDDNDDEDEESNEEGSKKHHATDVHLGKTLFIRNIAYATTEEDLKAKLEAYGPLRYCVFVKDRASGEPNGSAFVQYTAPTGADKCLTEAYRSKAFKKQKPTNTLRDLESDIVVDGRRLIITKAVDRKEAKQMTDTRKKNRDKRNLYLASEGVIKPNTEAAQELAKEEMQKRMRGQHGKNLKLANPNFHVSKTRLCVRNLPKDLEENGLKRIFVDAVKPLTQKNINTTMQQVKIVRDPARDNRSRGYGFVEFKEHAAALEALRVLNNNKTVLKNNQGLMVEFAIENQLVLQKRAFRTDAAKKRGAEGEGQKAAEGDNTNRKKRARDESGETEQKLQNKMDSGAKKPKLAAPKSNPNFNKSTRPQRNGDNNQGSNKQSAPQPRNNPNSRPNNRPPRREEHQFNASFTDNRVSLGGVSRKQRKQGSGGGFGPRKQNGEDRLEKLISSYKSQFE